MNYEIEDYIDEDDCEVEELIIPNKRDVVRENELAIELVDKIKSCSDVALLPDKNKGEWNYGLEYDTYAWRYLFDKNVYLSAALIAVHTLGQRGKNHTPTLAIDGRLYGSFIHTEIHRVFYNDPCYSKTIWMAEIVLSGWSVIYKKLKAHPLYGDIVDDLDSIKLGWLIDLLFDFRSLNCSEMVELQALATERLNWKMMC